MAGNEHHFRKEDDMNLMLRNRDFGLDAFEELSRFLDLGWENAGLYDHALSPAVDLVESDDGYTLKADLPGVDKKELELSVENNVLTIKGEKKGGNSEKKEKRFYRRETWSGSFRRTISLPQAADSANVEAQLKDGVLTVRIGKREELKPRQIPVMA